MADTLEIATVQESEINGMSSGTENQEGKS